MTLMTYWRLVFGNRYLLNLAYYVVSCMLLLIYCTWYHHIKSGKKEDLTNWSGSLSDYFSNSLLFLQTLNNISNL